MGTLDFLLTKPMPMHRDWSVSGNSVFGRLPMSWLASLVLSYGVYHYQGTVGVTQSLAFMLELAFGQYSHLLLLADHHLHSLLDRASG